MKTKTDLPSVKDLAKTFLMTDIKSTPHSPVIITHTFTDTDLYISKDAVSRRIY